MTENSDFPEKRRSNSFKRIAYGYKPAADDPCLLIPDEEMVPFIVQALDHIDKGGSLRETATWLTNQTGKSISHQGINNAEPMPLRPGQKKLRLRLNVKPQMLREFSLFRKKN